MIKFILSSFSNLSSKQLYDALELRQQVFMIEQECLYRDMDGEDINAEHLLLYEEEVLIGYLRIFEPGIKFEESSLGRIVVNPAYRGKDVGRKLIEEGIRITMQEYQTPIRIEAQAALLGYYEAFGFVEEGEVYEVDMIDHIQMVLALSSDSQHTLSTQG